MNGTARRWSAAAVTGLVIVLTGCAAEPVPAPPAEGSVLDAADVLSETDEQRLDALIEERNRDTDAARVAVLTVEEAGGPVEDYAREVATAWGVGDDGTDNGVLVVAATEDRQLRLEVADGVRERFSDEEAQDVVDDVLSPAFADGRYAEGLTEAVDRIYDYARGRQPAREPFDWTLFGWVAGAAGLVGGLLVCWIVAGVRRRRRIVDEELRAAEQRDPALRLTDEQREAYRRYRSAHRGDDAVANPAVWLPLYLANPALYSGGHSGGDGGGSSSWGGSSFGGGGGFTGGCASGGY